MPKYCVVIPSYNSESTILEAVKSAVDLDYSDYSIIVSDNGSEDDTVSVASTVESKRLKVISNDIFIGKSENWNRAYLQADDCQFFVNLHSDDVLDRNVLNYIDRVISDDVVLVHGSDIRISFDGRKVIKRRNFPFKYSLSGNFQRKSLLFGNSVGIVGTAIKRDAFHALGGWSLDYNFYQDVDLWYQLASIGRNVYVPKKFGLYRAPVNDNPEKFIEESIRWYEDKIADFLQRDLEKAAVNSLKGIVSRGLKSESNLPDELVQKMMIVMERYDHYPEYYLGTYLHNNITKLRGVVGL